MPTEIQPIASVEVCATCMFSRETGEAPELDIDGVPWSYLESADVTVNFGEDENGVEYGMTDFSWTPCDGCGSHLGGSRFTYAVWNWNDMEGRPGL